VRFETSIAVVYATIAVPYTNKYRYILGACFDWLGMVSEVINHYYSTPALESLNMTFL
jgi:hypothetical protein